MSEKRVMQRVYYTPSNPGSLGGVDKLHRAVQNEMGKQINVEKVRDFLSEQDAYTLHKPSRVHFVRNRVFVLRPLQQFQADLCDMQSLSKHNDGFNYLLTVIDVFSKKAYAQAIKKKTGVEVAKAFDRILTHSQIPKKMQTDAGKEFFNKVFQALLKKRGIAHYATASDMKACVVERFNRTLKTKMWRYFTAKNTHRYIDVLPELIESYNNSYHRSIKMTPLQVTKENAAQVFRNLYAPSIHRKKAATKMNFKEGELVRISKLRGVFDKKYEQSYTDELFTVSEGIPRQPPVYKLKDYDGEVIKGTFYEKELQKVKVSNDKAFQVEKILKRRVVRGKKQMYVCWKNWPEKFNSWVDAGEIKDV